MGSPLLALWRTRSIQWLLIRRELKVRYASSKLGYAWTVLDPLLSCLVFWLIFGVVFQAGTAAGTPQPYIVFLIAGYLPWQAISGAINGSARAIASEAKLVRSTSLPRELWVLRVIGAKTVELALSLPVLIAFMIVFQKGITKDIVFLPLAVVLMITAVTGIGLLLAPLTVLFKDLERVVRIAMRLLFYMTPVLYPSSRVITALDKHPGLQWVEHLYFLNPFVAVLDLYRSALWEDQFPGWSYIGISAAVSLILVAGGITVFRRLEGAVLKEI